MAEARRSLRAIFDVASEMAPGDERRAYLDQACGGDAALRAEVEDLLVAQEGAGGFLADPSRESPFARAGVIEGESECIGRYKLLQKIGEGGCGVVYMAEQTEPVRRRVALKVIKLGMDTRSVIARFEAERQALAMMDHASIARVLDAGATETGRPYFVMELVRGIKITDYCERNHLSTAARLRLFIKVCQAVQHAHQKGIIHRDLKPSNILVTSADGVPLPKVIDFGIAKATNNVQLTDKTLFTRFEMFIGTPEYMSPEQAEFNATDIDTRTDIYALGVLLYELLTGRTPFDSVILQGSGIEAMRKTIRETQPVRPSTRLTRELEAATATRPAPAHGMAAPAREMGVADVRRRLRANELIEQLRGDLDWIVLKALEKDRARRYDTANGLAMDIQRHLANEPIIARPPSMAYRVGKLVRRNRVGFASAAFAVLALVLGASGVMIVQHRANRDYRQRLYVSEVNRAGVAWKAGQTGVMRMLLDRCPPDLRRWEWDFLHQQSERWERQVVLTANDLGVVSLAAEAGLMAVANDGVIEVRSIPSGQWLRNIPLAGRTRSSLALAPRGDLLAVSEAGRNSIQIWNARTGEHVAELPDDSSTVFDWSNDGRRLAFAGEFGAIRTWQVGSGSRPSAFPGTQPVRALKFAPDDRTLAVGTAGRHIQLLDASSGTVRRTLPTRGSTYYVLKFSPDGRYLAGANGTRGGFGRDHRIWSLDEEDGSLELNATADALSFAFSSDSRQLLIGDSAGMIQVWDLNRRAEVERFSVQQDRVTTVGLLADHRILAAGATGAAIWRALRPEAISLTGYSESLRKVSFSPNGRWILAGGLADRVAVWDARNGKLAGFYTGHMRGPVPFAFSRDGRVASSDHGSAVYLWNPETFETLWETTLAPAANPYWLAFSPDGRRLYAPSRVDTLSVLDADTGRRLFSTNGLENILDGIAVSPDGRRIALCQKVKLSVRRAEDLHELWHVSARPERCAAFSPDGRWIATGDQDGVVSLWEESSGGRVHRVLRGHAASVTGVSFHPEGGRLASCSFDGLVKLWDWRAGDELLTLPLPGGGMAWHVAFSPDGRSIAAAGGDGVVTLWKVE